MELKFFRSGALVAATGLLTLTLAACGGGAGAADDAASAANDDAKLIAFVMPPSENPYYKAQTDAGVAKAEELGFEVLVQSHEQDSNKQDELMDTAIGRGADAIIIDPTDAETSVAAIQRAKDAGIPTFVIDREINKTGVAVAQIVSDNYQGATLVGQAFVDAVGETGKFVVIGGNPADTNHGIRYEGMLEPIKQYPGLELVAEQNANWDQNEAFQKMETILQAHSDIDGVLALNDTMALGASAALQAAGLTDVVVVGFDGSPDVLAEIDAGTIHATALQLAAEVAEMAVEQAADYLETGETDLPEKQLVETVLVTRENTADFGVFSYKN